MPTALRRNFFSSSTAFTNRVAWGKSEGGVRDGKAVGNVNVIQRKKDGNQGQQKRIEERRKKRGEEGKKKRDEKGETSGTI